MLIIGTVEQRDKCTIWIKAIDPVAFESGRSFPGSLRESEIPVPPAPAPKRVVLAKAAAAPVEAKEPHPQVD